MATLIATALNGSRPAINVARMGVEEAGLVCSPFATFHSMTCANDRCDGAPSPLLAAGALWGSGHHRYSLTHATTQQSNGGGWGLTKQTIYCLGRHLDKEEDEEETSDVRLLLLSFDSSFKNETTETGREAETATVM